MAFHSVNIIARDLHDVKEKIAFKWLFTKGACFAIILRLWL